jgi:hypothetical protein
MFFRIFAGSGAYSRRRESLIHAGLFFRQELCPVAGAFAEAWIFCVNSIQGADLLQRFGQKSSSRSEELFYQRHTGYVK